MENEKIEQLTRERDNWIETATQFHRDVEYYQGLLDQIAKNFGRDAYISNDGSIQEDPLRAKMPDLVANMAKELSESRRDSLRLNMLQELNAMLKFEAEDDNSPPYAAVYLPSLEQGQSFWRLVGTGDNFREAADAAINNRSAP